MTRSSAQVRLAEESTFSTYAAELRSKLKTGRATEHTYRGALQQFIEATNKGIEAVNEPKRVKCGAPDYILPFGLKGPGAKLSGAKGRSVVPRSMLASQLFPRF